MTFAHDEVLWLLAIFMPVLALFLIWTWRTKQKLVRQFVQSRLLDSLTVGVSPARQKLRLVLLFIATGLILVTLARPQWGFDWQEARQQGLDIIVAIDTSKSMMAQDLAPNRLARAKLAAFDLLKLAKTDRLGLIAFAGSAFLQCPLTLDEEAFRQSVNALDVNIIPQGGTALSEAIDTALSAFEKGTENHRVLVIFTDGEDHDSDAVAAAEKAAKEGLKIFTVGVGTREGELLRMQDEQGNSAFLKDSEGNVVKSRLDETLLQQIATKASGFYLPLVGANPMESLYAKGLTPLPKSDSASKLVRNYREQYKWPLGAAILLLLVEMFLPHRRVRRKKDMTDASSSGLKQAVGITILTFVPLFAFGSPSTAFKKYEAGKYTESFDDYQKSLAKKTNDYRLYFNAGDAAYRAREFERAEKYFNEAIVSPDLKLQQKAYYNLGNTLYQSGEPMTDLKEKQEAWEKAAKNFENAIKVDPQDADAKKNLAFMKQKLEELKKQQEQQKQQQSKDDQSKKDDKDQDKDKQQDKNQDQQKQNKDDKGKESDQKDQQQDQQKQDQAKSDQQKKDEEKSKQEQQQKKEQAKKDKQEEQKQESAKSSEDGQGKEQAEAAEAAAEMKGQMTMQQAQQFLEAQKQEDKPLIFIPQQQPKKQNGKIFKDW